MACADFAEFGKTDTVIVTLQINETEARRILEMLDPIVGDQNCAAVQGLNNLMLAIESGATGTIYIKEYNRGQD